MFVGRKDFGEKGTHVPNVTFPVTIVTGKPAPQTSEMNPNDGSRINSLNVDDMVVVKSSFECEYLTILQYLYILQVYSRGESYRLFVLSTEYVVYYFS